MKIEQFRKSQSGVMRTSLPYLTFLLLAIIRSVHAQNSPAGTWDCVISGTRSGLANLTFSSDTNGGTFDGVAIFAPKGAASPRTSIIAGMVAGLGSNGLSPRRDNNSDASTGTNLVFFGSGPVRGQWAFDAKGRIIGSFVETANQVCAIETNFLQ